MDKDWLSMKDLRTRYDGCAAGSIYNWMKRADNPFPRPCVGGARGRKNLWKREDVLLWEQSLEGV